MTKYKLQFTSQVNEDYTVIFDQKSYSGSETVVIGSGDVLTITSINNDDERFSPILSKECVLKVWITSAQSIGIEDFIATEDDEWRIIIYRDMAQPPIFDGYLIVEDSAQPLYDRPYPLTIRATDGLPLLQNVDLKMSDGSDFLQFNSLADYIGHVLYYVNPNINFRIYFDIYHADMNAAENPFEQINLDAKTFEKDETTFLDSYTVLERILTDTQCRLFYENGYWHVVSLWQYHNTTGYNYTEYKVVSDIVSKLGAVTDQVYESEVGKAKKIKFINKDAVLYYKVASKSVKKTFNYDLPKEIICNETLERGEPIPSLNGPDYKAYELECWEHKKYGDLLGFTQGLTPVNTAYIKRELDQYGYEKSRYIVLPSELNQTISAWLRSSRFFIGENDKITISLDFRRKNNYGGIQTFIVFYVFLRGDNGVNYTLAGDGKWHTTNATFTSGLFGPVASYNSDAEPIEWQTTTVEAEPAPTSGTVQLILPEQSAAAYPNETWFRNIQISYFMFILDNYKDFTGDYNIYSQNLKINRTIDEFVYISDSPKKIIKGSLFVGDELATPEWYRLGYTESLRFTQVMALIKYNFNYRQFQKVEGTLKGLSLYDASDNNIPFGFLPQYLLADTPASSSRYILTSMDVNYATGQWRGVLVEVRTGEDQTFDKYDFQYLFS